MEFCSLFYHKFLKKVNSFFQIYDKKERSPVLFPSNSHDVVGQHQVIFPPRQRPIEDGSDLAHAFRTVAVYAVANPVHIDERALSVIALVEQIYASAVKPPLLACVGDGLILGEVFPGNISL